MEENNIQSGGLICRLNEKLIIADVAKGIGMHWIQEDHQVLSQIMPWFLNVDEEDNLYYSDALKACHLCKMSKGDQAQGILVSEPIYLLKKYGDTLYYINEKNRHLYSYSLSERAVKKIISEEISVFTVGEDTIWYTSNKGILSTDLRGENREKIGKNIAMRLVYDNDKLVFIDKNQEYAVSYIDIKTGTLQTIEGSMSSSINVYDDLIFYNNIKDKSHIYRYSTDSEFNIKFIPERSDYIHIIGEAIYYFNQDNRVWMKVPIQGGKPVMLMG